MTLNFTSIANKVIWCKQNTYNSTSELLKIIPFPITGDRNIIDPENKWEELNLYL